MHRLVIALTALLTMVGAVVVGGYLVLFSASADRAARAVPDDAALYATIYLQPSTGQQLNLQTLLGHVPGFADPANLEAKIHEITQRLLGDAGLDYEADVRPWLGDQVSVVVSSSDGARFPDRAVLMVAVKDRAVASASLERIIDDLQVTVTRETYAEVEIIDRGDLSLALLDDLLVVGSDASAVEEIVDVDQGRRASLAASSDFVAANRRLPADHLGALYVDLRRAGVLAEQFDGYSTAALALVVEPDALHLEGSAAFDAGGASDVAREQFALAAEPSSLAEWMPAETAGQAIVFGLAQTLRAAEGAIRVTPGLEKVADALTQLRAIAALGLGVDLDEDVLPLLDREVAVAVQALDGERPVGQLIVRPADPEAGAAALERIGAAVIDRGGTVTQRVVDGTPVVIMALPEIGSIAHATRDGAIVLGLNADDVEAALAANASGESLAATDGYRRARGLAGPATGNELYLDIGQILDQMGTGGDLPADVRDILLSIDGLALAAPAVDDATEIHLVLTVR